MFPASKAVISSLLVVSLLISLSNAQISSPDDRSKRILQQVREYNREDAMKKWCTDRDLDYNKLVDSAQSRDGRTRIEGNLRPALDLISELVHKGETKDKTISAGTKIMGKLPALIVSFIMVLILILAVIFCGVGALISRIAKRGNTPEAQAHSEPNNNLVGNQTLDPNCPLRTANEQDIKVAERSSEVLRLVVIILVVLIICAMILTYLFIGFSHTSITYIRKSQCVIIGTYFQAVDGDVYTADRKFAGMFNIVQIVSSYTSLVDSLPITNAATTTAASAIPATLKQQSAALSTSFQALPSSSSDFAYTGLDGKTLVTPPSAVKYVDGVFDTTLEREVMILVQTSDKLSNVGAAFGTGVT